MRRFLAALPLCVALCFPALGQSTPGHGAGTVETLSMVGAKSRSAYARGSVVGGRPSGCPSRYCGCASARYLGIPNPGGRLNLAANWLRLFPRTSPAPRMAAARRGHVFVILRVTGPGKVLAFDPNSGRGATRVHERSLAGFTVVNPHARYASAQ